MAFWYVWRGSSSGSVAWTDGKQGDVYVYCNNTGHFHSDPAVTYQYYTGQGPYRFSSICAGQVGIDIQEGVGQLDIDSSVLRRYQDNPEYLTVRNVMLTEAGSV